MLTSVINTGAIAAALIAIVTLVILVFKIFKMVSDMYQTMKDRIQLFDKWQTDIPQMDKKLNHISDIDIPRMDKKLNHIGTLVDTIVTYIKKEDRKFMQSYSPVSLNDDGKRLVDSLNIKHIIDVNYEKLYASLDEKKPNTAYDVQELSMEIMRNFLKDIKDEEILTNMKKAAYQESVSLDSLYPVFSIVLRDRIIEEKGFNLEEIGKDNPKW